MCRLIAVTILTASFAVGPALAEEHHLFDPPPPRKTEVAQCIDAARAHEQVQDAVDQADGFAVTLGTPGAQAFADGWRRRLGLPLEPVLELVIWLIPARLTAVVSEIGPGGCMITTTPMTTDDFSRLLGSVPPVRGPRA